MRARRAASEENQQKEGRRLEERPDMKDKDEVMRVFVIPCGDYSDLLPLDRDVLSNIRGDPA
jgi:hypothetical protein